VAKDKFYPAYSGKLSNLRMVLCNGAFDPKFPVEPPAPKTPEVPPKPEPEPTCIEGSSQIGEAAFNKPAVVDIKVKQEEIKDSRDYGYGYWLRF
jgi:hypothetical protein